MFFSTNNITPAGRRDAWVAAIAGQCGAFQIEFDRDPFEGSLDVRNVGRFRCARIMQTSKETSRLSRHVHANNAETYFVILQVAGRSRLEQFGRTADMAAGDITIIDANAPSAFHYHRKNIQLSLHIPKCELKAKQIDWSDALATKLPRGRGMLVNSIICSAFHSGNIIDDTQGEVISDAILGLLAAGWASAARPVETFQPDDTHAQLLQSIQNYVIGHLEDENLSPRLIARENGLSERQLHRIFQASGQTICQWIRQSRLDRCAADFRDPHKQGRTITEIAFRWGFNDAAHFSRVFRSEFGQPPRAYRAAASQN